LYVIEVDGETAATVTLLWGDPFFSGEQSPDAACVHKLAIGRGFAGHGLGEAIVGFEHRGDRDHPRFPAALYERRIRP
jgi:hypothetical protein